MGNPLAIAVVVFEAVAGMLKRRVDVLGCKRQG